MNSRHRFEAGRFLLRALILAGFSFYITYLVNTGNIVYYIAPRMEIYVKLTALGLYLIASYQAFLALRSWNQKQTAGCECGCEETSPVKAKSRLLSLVVYSLFLFPLLLGYVLPDNALNSSLAAKRGVNLGPSSAQTGDQEASLQSESSPNVSSDNRDSSGSSVTDTMDGNSPHVTAVELDGLFPADEYMEPFANLAKALYQQDVIEVNEEGFIETLSAIDLFVEPFVGKTIRFSGFVYREDDMQSNQFALTRFQIQCCSADALPFGIMVEYDRAQNYATDSWLQVEGTIGQTLYNDFNIIKVDAATIKSIEAPSSPYVYPNYDYFYSGANVDGIGGSD